MHSTTTAAAARRRKHPMSDTDKQPPRYRVTVSSNEATLLHRNQHFDGVLVRMPVQNCWQTSNHHPISFPPLSSPSVSHAEFNPIKNSTPPTTLADTHSESSLLFTDVASSSSATTTTLSTRSYLNLREYPEEARYSSHDAGMPLVMADMQTEMQTINLQIMQLFEEQRRISSDITTLITLLKDR